MLLGLIYSGLYVWSMHTELMLKGSGSADDQAEHLQAEAKKSKGNNLNFFTENIRHQRNVFQGIEMKMVIGCAICIFLRHVLLLGRLF
jgi:hypothetical protein